MIVKTSYMSLFFLREKYRNFSWNLSYHITVKPQKPQYAKMVYKTAQNIWTVVSQKERQLQNSNPWPTKLQLSTLTSQPWRQLDRWCFFHRHYLQLAPTTLSFSQSKRSDNFLISAGPQGLLFQHQPTHNLAENIFFQEKV